MGKDIKVLDFVALNDLDNGLLAAAVLDAVKKAAADCYDRPGDKKARKVTLQIELVPITETAGGMVECRSVGMEFVVRCRVPDLVTKRYELDVNRHGHLKVNLNNPQRFDQGTIDDVLEEEEE